MSPGDEEDMVIPATPEPSVSRNKKERRRSTGKPFKLSFTNNDTTDTSGDDTLLDSAGVRDDTPPPPTDDTDDTVRITHPGNVSNDDLSVQSMGASQVVVDKGGAVGGDVQRPVGVLTVDKSCQYVRGGVATA